MANTAVNMYKQNSVETAPREDLTLMLYNGAIKFIKRAKQAIEEKDFNNAHQFNIRAQDIVNELIITLDRSYPIAEQMLPLYEFFKRRLVEANVAKDVAILDEIEGFFTEFRDTWKQAMVIARSQKK